MSNIRIDAPLGKDTGELRKICNNDALWRPQVPKIRQTIITLCDALERTHERADRNEACYVAMSREIEDLAPDESLVDAFYDTMLHYGDLLIALDRLRDTGVEVPMPDARERCREHNKTRRQLREAYQEIKQLRPIVEEMANRDVKGAPPWVAAVAYSARQALHSGGKEKA